MQTGVNLFGPGENKLHNRKARAACRQLLQGSLWLVDVVLGLQRNSTRIGLIKNIYIKKWIPKQIYIAGDI